MLRDLSDRLLTGALAKSILGFLLVLATELTDLIPLKVATLVFFLVIVDTGLGLGRAMATQTLESSRMYRGAIKLGVYSVLVLLGAAMELVGTEVPGLDAISSWWVEWILAYLALTEAVSILEHIAEFAAVKQIDLPGLQAVLRLLRGGKRKLDEKLEEG
jgi:phage-related holin